MSLSAIATPYTYDILLEIQPDGTHQASILGWAECRAVAATAAEAVAQVKELLSDRMAKGQIVRVEIPRPNSPDTSNPENPGLLIGGMNLCVAAEPPRTNSYLD
jgi:predicted RNase H-like HicB family nuclease